MHRLSRRFHTVQGDRKILEMPRLDADWRPRNGLCLIGSDQRIRPCTQSSRRCRCVVRGQTKACLPSHSSSCPRIQARLLFERLRLHFCGGRSRSDRRMKAVPFAEMTRFSCEQPDPPAGIGAAERVTTQPTAAALAHRIYTYKNVHVADSGTCTRPSDADFGLV